MVSSTSDVVVRVDNQLPKLRIDHDFVGGSVTAVVGPNGAGKTTLLRTIAGLTRADSAQLSVGADVLDGPGTRVAAHRRGVALLGQDARLFPHLTVTANVAFAPQAQRLDRAEVTARVAHWLAACEVADLADRKPAQLSGGQAQRVAIARALAAQPRMLLLDEPFRALDVDVAGRLRALLRDLLVNREQTTIFVTHDVVDVVTLADHVLVLDDGCVVDAGASARVLSHPSNAFTANLAGLNLVAGRWDGAAVVGDHVALQGFAAEPLHTGGPATAVFAPDAVVVSTSEPVDTSMRNVLPVTVTQVVPRGDRFLVRASAAGQDLGAEVTRDALSELGIAVGTDVYFAVKATSVRVY